MINDIFTNAVNNPGAFALGMAIGFGIVVLFRYVVNKLLGWLLQV